ncbi:MAG TPA: cytochrome d ubiquinol oxidase subunit II [Muribaculaceae bacterium]|jgi:cytochrome d ubiquinol oxidase subunit II|nr:cytochrome d ubiquinol oxidase subunit II [Muribaculaceae bacterium]
MELATLQQYWWLIISVLGALLVFMLFIQGGQSLLYCTRSEAARQLMVNSLGRKWELTFTILVTFGGAFFASFPLFYSTSFGGAYWLWMLILVSFVLQAVSYEFRRKRGNIYGTATYDIFLMANGLVGCILLGVAVGTFFFGGEFTVAKGNIINGASPVISTWSDSHGWDAITDWRCLLLGLTVFFLARTQASLYFINNISDARHEGVTSRIKVLFNGGFFAILFICFVLVLLTSQGVRQQPDGTMVQVQNIYLGNLTSTWWWAAIFTIGTVMVLYAIIRTGFSSTYRKGIWWSGTGTIMVVIVLFWLAGYNSTSYLPSVTDIQSSLTLANSSSSLFTLTVMTWVSILVPFVIAYIAYVWHKMDKTPLTEAELEKESHTY